MVSNARTASVSTAGAYDAIIGAVAHREFAAISAGDLSALGKDGAIIYDLKAVLPAEIVDLRL